MAKRAQPQKRKAPPRKVEDQADRIVDSALEMAADIGWPRVRLRLIADRLGITMAELQTHYRDLDAVADAWFDRASKAMLARPGRGFTARPAAERLHILLMRWFDALAPYRRVTDQMIREKLYPSHPHHWLPMIFNLSRTIQWLRDAAGLDAGGRRRQVEEIGLSLLFLATLSVWRRDDSADQKRTRDFLSRRLDRADRSMARLWGEASPAA